MIKLNLPVPILEEEKKIKLNVYFYTFCGASKGFMKALIKPFEAPKRSAKIKIYLNFYFNITFRNARDVKVNIGLY